MPRCARFLAGAVCVVVALGACGDGGRPRSATTSTAAGSSSTTAPVTGTPVGVIDPVLRAATDGDPATPVDVEAASCRGLVPVGAEGDCGDVGMLTWVVAGRSADGRVVRVYRREGQGRHLVEWADDRDGSEWSTITVRAVGTALAVAFRDPGTGQFLDVDLVDPSGAVGASVQLDHGRAAVSGDRLDTWSAQFGPDDPNCCPSAWAHQVLARGRDAWVVVAEDQVDHAPAGDFP